MFRYVNESNSAILSDILLEEKRYATILSYMFVFWFHCEILLAQSL
jgi:hypothetical protein